MLKKIREFKAPNWVLLLLPSLLFVAFGMRQLGLPGLYMDAVNPDYQASWLLRGALNMPTWLYPDNYIAGVHKYPLLNSLYGGNATAYMGLVFFKLVGFGASEVRLFHSLLAIILLISMAWCLQQWKAPRLYALLFVALLASDPTFIFSWRAQYYLQLFPLIFLFFGAGLLGQISHNDNGREVRAWPLLFSGVLIGFSAYSYFIFAIYVAVILIGYFLLNAGKLNRVKSAAYLLLGILIGYLPYIYAHLSIILNTNFQTYVDSIKGLQSQYGVIDNNQGGLLSRLAVVRDRLVALVAGQGVEVAMFGDSPIVISKVLRAAGALLLIPIIHPVRQLLAGAPVFAAVDGVLTRNKAFLFLALLSCVLLHLLFGLTLGRTLLLQHYVMLLPIAYILLASMFSMIDSLSSSPGAKAAIKTALTAVSLVLIVLNLSVAQKFSARLAKEGGRYMYSDVINIVGAHINGLPGETALLFPQWGYWMGVSTITGPRYSFYETPGVKEMEKRLVEDPELKKHKKLLMVLGRDFANGDTLVNNTSFDQFAEHTGLKLVNVSTVYGRNGVDKVFLAQFERP